MRRRRRRQAAGWVLLREEEKGGESSKGKARVGAPAELDTREGSSGLLSAGCQDAGMAPIVERKGGWRSWRGGRPQGKKAGQ